MKNNNSKIINYQNILTFKIPNSWIEEYDDSGGVFYEDHPTSGTLRVKLISIDIPRSKNTINHAVDILYDISAKESKIIILPNGNTYTMSYEETVDDGIEITIYYWHLIQAIKNNKTRLVNLSYTILTDKLNTDSIRHEISYITKEVENIQFL